jgi:hypothetical protein
MTREYEPAPTTKATQKQPRKNVEDPVRILGLWKIQVVPICAEKPKRPTEYPHLPNEAPADTGVSVNVTIALPSSLIPTDASTSRRAISPTLWATRLPRSAEPCGCENRCPPRSFPTARLLDLHQTDGRGLLNQVGQDNHHSLIMRFLDQREISAPITTPIRR